MHAMTIKCPSSLQFILSARQPKPITGKQNPPARAYPLEHTPLEHTPLEHTTLEHTPLEHTPLEHTRPHILLYKASIPLISKAKMNTLINQTLWANSLNVDEVVHWEVKNLCNLMNAIFSEAIDNQVNKLRLRLHSGSSESKKT